MHEKNRQQPVFSDQGNTTAKLRELMARAQVHQSAEQTVMEALPEELAPGTRFVSCQDGELVLATDTASKATRLRFRQHEIMEALREHELFRFVWKLRVKVSPARYRARRETVKTPLTKENARLLKEEAGHTKDKALPQVPQKLPSQVPA
ncbi:MAG: DUF721 domain-containing protein [Alteromonadaceae bacterium]|nr:DUF721 domain-containing protein [Alteromonadaceae bacterium]